MTTAPSVDAVVAAVDDGWTLICRYDELLPEQGASVLLGDVQIAVFRTFDGALYALGNQDPFTGAFVMSRGIVGSLNGIPTVASPLHKQVFSLVTGECLDAPHVVVPSFAVRRRGDHVEVSVT
jgi:nitrite reductase (NADH) small subunit